MSALFRKKGSEKEEGSMKERSLFTNKELMGAFERAIAKWGEQFQLNMVAEECCELAKAVLKFNRKINGSTIREVIDEMADVYIMLGQLEILLMKHYQGEDLNNEINSTFDRKIQRLMRMLDL